MAKRTGYSTRDVALVRKLRQEGASLGWIAAKLDVPKSTVNCFCNGRRRDSVAVPAPKLVRGLTCR